MDKEKCTECYICQNVCPMDIKIFADSDSHDCIKCGRCIRACPQDALKFKYGMTPDFINTGAIKKPEYTGSEQF